MSHLDDLATTITTGLTGIGLARQALIEAADNAAASGDSLAQVLTGTIDPKVTTLRAQFDDASARCRRSAAWLDSATTTLQAYLASLGRPTTPQPRRSNQQTARKPDDQRTGTAE